MHPTGNPRLIDRMVSEGLVTIEQREAALNQHQLVGGRIEEALLELGFLTEPVLLKFLAAEYKTRFVTSEKLARADIPVSTLALVPKKMADQDSVFPVLFDEANGVLSIVTPDADNSALSRQVQMASGVRQVRALVGRPLAVRAAIAKHYNGDIHAFAQLDRSAHEQFASMLNVFERNLVSEESMIVSLAGETTKERMLTSKDMDGPARGATTRGGAVGESNVELLNVLVSLLENTRNELRGHSAQVSRIVRKIAERIGLGELQTTALQVAALCHDLGKMTHQHLTPLNVSEYEPYRQVAEKAHRAPLRLLEAVNLSQESKQALLHMYERFDGKGVPGDLAGKEIPLGARILAIADTYADLTENSRNPFRKVLTPAQACEVLARYGGKLFDANLVDVFRNAVTGEDLRARLLASRRVVLLIEPDPEESTVIELRMVEQGLDVHLARTAEVALKLIDKEEIDIVVSEVELEQHDGVSLMAEMRGRSQGEKIAWVFVTSRGGRADAQRAFDLGAADYIQKPVSPDLLVAKVKQILEREGRVRGGRGVSGSLQEMGLPEIVQVLWHGRKTGALRIRSGASSGEIHFVDGAIHNAMWGNLRGTEGFYAMLALAGGEFALDPNFRAAQQVINESPEALLLEGMRRMDEGTAGIDPHRSA